RHSQQQQNKQEDQETAQPRAHVARSVVRRSVCVSEEWVARATRLLRLATRRPELRIATSRKGHPHWLEPLLPLRPASRRTAQAGRLCYPKTIFQTRSNAQMTKEALIHEIRMDHAERPGRVSAVGFCHSFGNCNFG